ncbi:MAG: cell division protein SepF [Yaniella sp.]|uniref:cell division protein SepF n=1 Tax=Yaniella sp. TaxID=2773929 RepID=UPI0017E88F22|nr:cell division protein SepF [Micrococcus sp.]
MVSGLRKAMIRMGLADSDEAYEQELIEEERKASQAPAEPAPKPEVREAAPVTTTPVETPQAGPRAVPNEDDDYRAPVTPIKRVVQSREESAEVHKLRTIHPRSYNDAKLIGEAIRSGIPVIINVTDMSEAEAKRLVDFSAGLAFGLHGAIERVTNKVFLLTPTNVENVIDGHSATAHDEDFFDQA